MSEQDVKTMTGKISIKVNKGVASLKERVQIPCGACKRKTYRLNAQHNSVCSGCDDDDFNCECSPVHRIGTQLIG